MILKRRYLWPPNWCCYRQGLGAYWNALAAGFARRYVTGEPVRSIKSDPLFIEQREYVLSRVFEQREAFS
jgi:taurine transport system ATP-binding protein